VPAATEAFHIATLRADNDPHSTTAVLIAHPAQDHAGRAVEVELFCRWPSPRPGPPRSTMPDKHSEQNRIGLPYKTQSILAYAAKTAIFS
jgi:hypothetical protein